MDTINLFMMVLRPYLPLILTVLVILLVYYIFQYIKFKQSIYKSITNNSFLHTIRDTGLYGEYLTVRLLEKIPNGRIIANVYLYDDKQESTENSFFAFYRYLCN